MTLREKRLLRLAHLRERQHDIAAVQLRAARSSLAVAQSSVKDAQERARAAGAGRLAAASDSEPDEWLLACLEADAALLAARNGLARLARATAVVQQAAELEAAARRERKQMEATLESVQLECAEAAARADQRTLDEVARLQRAGSAVRALLRRDL